MAKYDPLNRYLRRQNAADVVLTFTEIENLLTALLPGSASRREWWVNDAASTNVQARAWMEAGYDAFPETGRERVTFRRRAARLEGS